MAILAWRHYGDHEVAPLCRSRNGAIGAVADIWECFDPDARLLQRRLGLRPGRPRRGFRASAGLPHRPSERLLEELASKGMPSVLVDQGSAFRGGLRSRQVVKVVGAGLVKRWHPWLHLAVNG